VGLGKIGQPKGGIRINLETQQLPGRMRMLINSDRRQPLTSIRCLRKAATLASNGISAGGLGAASIRRLWRKRCKHPTVPDIPPGR
jgi:hypothetical protein